LFTSLKIFLGLHVDVALEESTEVFNGLFQEFFLSHLKGDVGRLADNSFKAFAKLLFVSGVAVTFEDISKLIHLGLEQDLIFWQKGESHFIIKSFLEFLVAGSEAPGCASTPSFAEVEIREWALISNVGWVESQLSFFFKREKLDCR
jgi:hypothetical protein